MVYKKKKVETSKDIIRTAAEESLHTFITLIAPHRVLGAVHEEILSWWVRDEALRHQLVLMPRDHQKSALVAYRVAWELTKNPERTFLYISATCGLAEKQLFFIKNILTSPIYRRYWPEIINKDEGKRERWTTTEISVDHPKRREEGIRDPSILTAGLTTTITGLHFDIAVLDDTVVKENAYTGEGRTKVEELYSLLASVEAANSQEWVVGTRYHPKDLYGTLIGMEKYIYNDVGEVINKENVYEVFQRQVESRGDGIGEFLWPRQRRKDGKWFGFSMNILAEKKAKYLDRTQFYAQYYNDPNDPESMRLSKDKFQYYDKKFLEQRGSYWYYRERRLNVTAAIDFAFSLKAKADYTAIVVVGVDADKNIYVLDIDRFKTDRISEYFKHILQMYTMWEFRKLRAEVTVAQAAIVKELKESYIKQYGLALSVDEYRPNRHEGSKHERIAAILEPRYDNLVMWHYKGGNCQLLEEELILAKPPHDDLKDGLASAVEIAVPPVRARRRSSSINNSVDFNNRFGGVQWH